MSKTSLRLMFINLENLFTPGVEFYERIYSPVEYAQKINWISNRIAENQVHVVAMSELGDDANQAIADILAAVNEKDIPSWVDQWGDFQHEHRAEPGSGSTKIRTAIISRFPLTNTDSLSAFPDGFAVDFFSPDPNVVDPDWDDLTHWRSIPITRFSRPIAKAQVNPPDKPAFNLFALHLKSKRARKVKHDDWNEATGIARSAVQRNIEAAALRYYMDNFLPTQFVADNKVASIVIGDFNDTPNSVPLENIRGPFDANPGAPSTWSELDKRRLISCARLHRKFTAYEDKLFSYVHNEDFSLLDQAFVTQHWVNKFKRFEIYNDHVLRHSELATNTATAQQWKTTVSDHGIVILEFTRVL